jgi:hypothetical protein
MIQVKAGELLVAQSALMNLAQLKLPVKSAYHVSKLTRLAGQELQDIERQREALVREFGSENPDKSVTVKPDRMPEFQEKYKELAEIEVKLDWNPIPFEMLEHSQLTANDVTMLGSLLAEPKVKGAQNG